MVDYSKINMYEQRIRELQRLIDKAERNPDWEVVTSGPYSQYVEGGDRVTTEVHKGGYKNPQEVARWEVEIRRLENEISHLYNVDKEQTEKIHKEMDLRTETAHELYKKAMSDYKKKNPISKLVAIISGKKPRKLTSLGQIEKHYGREADIKIEEGKGRQV